MPFRYIPDRLFFGLIILAIAAIIRGILWILS